MIKIVIKGEPPRATAQQKGERIVYSGGRPYIHHYVKNKVGEAADYYRHGLIKHRPKKPLSGAIYLDVVYVFKASSMPKNRWKTTRPDCDNMVKLLKDVMTELGFWNDDSQVATEIITKVWGTTPGTYIIVNEMDPISDIKEILSGIKE